MSDFETLANEIVGLMTCAIPGSRLGAVVEALRTVCEADRLVASYASEDGKRFA